MHTVNLVRNTDLAEPWLTVVKWGGGGISIAFWVELSPTHMASTAASHSEVIVSLLRVLIVATDEEKGAFQQLQVRFIVGALTHTCAVVCVCTLSVPCDCFLRDEEDYSTRTSVPVFAGWVTRTSSYYTALLLSLLSLQHNTFWFYSVYDVMFWIAENICVIH